MKGRATFDHGTHERQQQGGQGVGPVTVGGEGEVDQQVIEQKVQGLLLIRSLFLFCLLFRSLFP